MKITDNPQALLDLQPIVEHFVRKNLGASKIEPAILEDGFAEAYTGMLCNPLEDFPDHKSLLNALISKTAYHVQAENNHRRSENHVRALFSETEPIEPPETSRRCLSWLRGVPDAFLWTLPRKTRVICSLLRDGLSYAQTAELAGVVHVEGFLSGLPQRYNTWINRPASPTLPEDVKTWLSKGKYGPLRLRVVQDVLEEHAVDLVALRCRCSNKKVSDILYETRQRFPLFVGLL
jgi:hypothetical protein